MEDHMLMSSMLKRKPSSIMEKGRRGIFYRKTLIWLLLTASVPGFITGLSIYWFGIGQIETHLSGLHQKQMEERVQNIDDQLSYLELDLSHWAFSPRFDYSLKDLDFIYNFRDTRDISKSLVVMQGSHPLIHDVEMFIQRPDPVVFKTEHYRLYNSESIEDYEKYLSDSRHVYWVEGGPDNDNSILSEAPLTLVHKIPGGSSEPFGVLIVTLKQDKVVNLLKTMTPYNEGVTFLLDENGAAVLSDSDKELAEHTKLKDEIANRAQRSGTFLWEHSGKTYSVSYGQLKRIDKEWTYVSASPMTAITSPVVALSKVILNISSASLILALVLSWLASVRMYSPIARLMRHLNPAELHTEAAKHRRMDEFQFMEKLWSHTASESTELQLRLKAQESKLRTGFLLQLLQGHFLAYSESDLRERMQHYGWEVAQHKFCIVYIRLTGMDSSLERFSSHDESLVTFAASNITEELASMRFEQIHAMNFHDLSVGLFIIVPEQQSVAEPLQLLGEELTAAINQLLKLQVTITISRPVEEVKGMTAAFMELERAAGLRQFVNRNQLINMEEIPNDLGIQEVKYPFALELDIIQSMRNGDQAAAEELVAQFIQETLSYQGTEAQVQMSMLQLLGSMQHMMLQSGVNPSTLFQGENRFARLSQIRNPDKMLSWMKDKVILPYLQERETRAHVQLKQIIDQTLIYIQSNYNEDISLESCADQVGMNFYTLSKLFKQVTGVNFIDYLTELRITKAKELLRSTGLRVNDIAEEVGYQQRYFNRIFKKQVGITPSEYRESAG